jgi:hypothetical protein
MSGEYQSPIERMNSFWYHDLYKIGSVAGAWAVALRVTVAVGVPLVGGVLIGHPAAAVAGGATALFVTMSDMGTTTEARLGTMFCGWLAIACGATLGHVLDTTPYGREAVVLLCALVAGWASGSYPAIATITRFFAVAAAAGTGMRLTDPDVLASIAVGGASAFVATLLVWRSFSISRTDNLMDWRSAVMRAFAGADSGPRFAVCYAASAAVALFAATWLGVQDPYWATLVVLMVMRREGIASLELTIHYAAGTVIGVVVAAGILHWIEQPLALAVLATFAAAFARVGLAINPSLGYMAFSIFLLFVVNLIMVSAGKTPQLFGARIYDVTVGCVLALAGTLAAIYPRSPDAPRVADAGVDSAASPPEQ